MENGLKAKIRVHLFTKDKCFGPGICQLLEAVEELGSLRKAAQSMDMAYSKAWKIIKLCEENLGFSLLESTTGGKGGGGAVVTLKAKEMVTAYRNFCLELEDFAEGALEKNFKSLR